MKLNSTMLALSLGLCAVTASAQTIDLGPDATGYRRFLLYPHLEKGFDALNRGERVRALAEFEQALTLAPNNPVVAMHLAEAYRHFGEPARAEAVLREQLTRHPGHSGLSRALSELRARTSSSLLLSVPPPPFGAKAPSQAAQGQTRADWAAADLSAEPDSFHAALPAAALVRVAAWSGLPDAAATPAPDLEPDSAYEWAAQAYQASKRGDHGAAVLAARHAVALAPDSRAYHSLLVYELMETGQLEEADAIALKAPPATPDTPADAPAAEGDQLAVRHQQLRQQLASRRLALSAPAVGVTVAAAPADAVAVADPAYAAADEAYKAFGAKNYEEAASKAQQALQFAPDNLQYRLLRVQSLSAAGQLAQADQEASGFVTAAQAQGQPSADMLALRSSVRQRMGQNALAALDAEAALQGGGLSASSQIGLLLQLGRKQQARERFAAAQRDGDFAAQADVDTAYLALQVGDDAAALRAFDQAASTQKLPDSALQDAAYVAGRLGHNEASIDYFKRAIDAAEAGSLALTPQQKFETRRSIADRSRQAGVYGSLTYRGLSLSGLPLAQGAPNDSIQSGVEAYWRPFGYGDGRLFELYGGLSGTLYSNAGLTTGAPSVEGSLGARVKPLADSNLIFALERRLAIGAKANSDWLARVGYSWSTGMDLRVDKPDWWSAQLYAEAGRFIKRKQNFATFEGQAGRSFRLDGIAPRLVIFPHLVLGADHNNGYEKGHKEAVGAGVGTSLRYWFNEDKYNAPRSYWDMSLQYRGLISGDQRAKGVFLRFTLAY